MQKHVYIISQHILGNKSLIQSSTDLKQLMDWMAPKICSELRRELHMLYEATQDQLDELFKLESIHVYAVAGESVSVARFPSL